MYFVFDLFGMERIFPSSLELDELEDDDVRFLRDGFAPILAPIVALRGAP